MELAAAGLVGIAALAAFLSQTLPADERRPWQSDALRIGGPTTRAPFGLKPTTAPSPLGAPAPILAVQPPAPILAVQQTPGPPLQAPAVQQPTGPLQAPAVQPTDGRTDAAETMEDVPLWEDPNAFKDAVARKLNQFFKQPGQTVGDDEIFSVCKNAFARFAVKFGTTIFATGETSSVDAEILKLTLNTNNAGVSEGDIGKNFGPLAIRYMELRRHVAGPYVVHSSKPRSAAARRMQLWRNGWEATDGYRELTPVEQARRSPGLFIIRKNWTVFLHLHVQFTMMEMLLFVFIKVAQEFSLNPLSWNNEESRAMTQAVDLYTAAILGGQKVATVKKQAQMWASVVTISAGLIKSFSKISAGSLLEVVPTIVKGIANVNSAGGKVKISDRIVAQLNSSNKGHTPGGIRLVFDDLADFAAVLQLTSESHLGVPSYLLN